MLEEVSTQVCPKCQQSYRLHGVTTHQELYCFKCGALFESMPAKMTTAKKKKRVEENLMSEAVPTIEIPTPVQTPIVKKRPGGSWTWMIFFTFILYCVVKAVTEPIPQNVSQTLPQPEVTPMAETPIPVPEPVVFSAPATEVPIVATAPIAADTNEGTTYFDAKDYSRAATALESTLLANPSLDEKTRMDCLWKLAVSAEKIGQVSAAIDWNKKLLQEFGKEKDWKVRSAAKALARLSPLLSSELKNP